MTYPNLVLELNGSGVKAERKLSDTVPLIFHAQAIRDAPTGIHARLEISRSGILLGWTACNVEKDEERLRLVNRIHRLLPKEEGKEYINDFLKHDLDFFCQHLWETYISQFAPENAAGLEGWEPEFMVEPFVIKGGGTIVFAGPGAGKSYMALLMAQSVNRGVSTLWPCIYHNAMFVNLERSPVSIRGRLARINTALGLPPTDRLHIMDGRGRSLRSLAPAIERHVRDQQIEFGVLDSISRTGMGGLITAEDVNPVVDLMSALFPTWLAIAHTPRASEEHIYGGQMWDAGADITLRLTPQLNEKDSKKLGVALNVTKANDIAFPLPQYWELDFNNGLSVRKAILSDYPELRASGKVPLVQEVLDYLLKAGKATATQVATELGCNRGKVASMFNHDSRFVRVGGTGPKGQVYYSAK